MLRLRGLTRLLVAVAALLIFVPCGHGSGRDYVFLYYRAQVEFEPEQVYFIAVDNRRGFNRTLGVAVPLESKEPGIDHEQRSWLLGSQVPVESKVESIRFSVLLLGPDGEIEFLPLRKITLAEDPTARLSPPELREYLLERRALLKSWEVQFRAQEQSLGRLQRDAELIGDLGRIVELKHTLAEVEMEQEEVREQIEGLKRLLLSVKNVKTPAGFRSRERSLTNQLSLLAKAAQSAESGEFVRRSSAEEQLQRKLELIQATRYEDEDALARELEYLQSRTRGLPPRPSGEPVSPEQSFLP